MNSRLTLRSAFMVLLLATYACGHDAAGEPPASDGGDAGGNDAGGIDAGTQPLDAGGTPDSGMPDAAPVDTGTPEVDASEDDDASAAPTRAVTIRFAAKVGESDFACGETYPGIGAMATTIEARELRFYVQDLQLLRADGSAVPVQLDVRAPWQSETVALIDLAPADSSCAGYGTAETNAEITGRVPEGEYTGIVFVNGVPEDLNHGDLPELPPPLQVGGMQWGWLLGYRFFKLEVAEVVTPPEIAGIGSLHAGSTGCSGAPLTGFTCARGNRNRIELGDFDPDANTVVLDVAEVFSGVDLGIDAQCHGSGPTCELTFPEVGIDFATGNALPTQNVYRVE